MWWHWYFIALIIISAIVCWSWGVRLFCRERFLSGLVAMLVMPMVVAGTFWVSTLVWALVVYGL